LDFFFARLGDLDPDFDGDLLLRVLDRDLDLLLLRFDHDLDLDRDLERDRRLRTGDLVLDLDRRFNRAGDDRRRGDFDLDFLRRDLDPDRERALERELLERPRDLLRRERDLDLERRPLSSLFGDVSPTCAFITLIPQLADVGLFTTSRPVRNGFRPAAILSLSGFTIGLFACSTLRQFPPKNTPLYCSAVGTDSLAENSMNAYLVSSFLHILMYFTSPTPEKKAISCSDVTSPWTFCTNIVRLISSTSTGSDE